MEVNQREVVGNYTRDETRTRKARRPGDFESPASTDSATRAGIGIYTSRPGQTTPSS